MNKLAEREIHRIMETAEKLAIPPGVVEKDIFVTRAIHALADLHHPFIKSVFCGGTYLGKAYQIVSRMSEDVGFKIFPELPDHKLKCAF